MTVDPCCHFSFIPHSGLMGGMDGRCSECRVPFHLMVTEPIESVWEFGHGKETS